MNCPSCQHSNTNDARFCNQCGTALNAGCSQCGAENTPGSRFCNQCGNNLAGEAAPAVAPSSTRSNTSETSNSAAPKDYTPKHLADRILSNRSALEGERKQVTVMFADLKGSLDLAEQVDAERWHEILDEFFSILGEEVHRNEGTINQYTGDGIMALFGAPIAHEDHAVRACRAALALRDRLAEFGQRLRLKDGLNISVRIGLNSGEVIVGTIGDDLRMDYTAQGHTVGLAARMESLAAPGSVLLTRYTARLVDGYFKLNNLGASQVKGVSQPIELYELVAEGHLRSRLDLSRERGLSPFIGREGEFESLVSILQYSSTAPRGKVAALEGDAGIGKSRLCHEVAEAARRDGIDVFTCACVPYADAVPFHPIRELLKAYFGILENDNDNVARQKMAGALTLLNLGTSESLQLIFEFLEIADPQQPGLNIPPDQRLQKLFELYDQFNAAAPNRRSLIIVDDLHWADSGSLAFLERMWSEVHEHPVSIIFNYRPHEQPSWLEKSNITLSLTPLDEPAMLELAERLIGCDPELAPLRKRLAERAAGNPYFVEEALHAFLEAGTLAGEAGALRLTKPVEDVKIPDTIHAVIGARIDRLNETQKQVLLAAAVIGKQLARQTLLALLEKTDSALADETLLAELYTLKTLGFMTPAFVDEDCDEASPCHWQFRHPLVQEVAYHSQLKTRRQNIHSQLAELIEAEAGADASRQEASVQLAHHYERAKNWDKAAYWMPIAATWLAGRDMEEALRRYRYAVKTLDTAPESPAVMHGRVTARAGILRVATFFHLGDDEEAERAWIEAKALVKTSQDTAALAELQVSYAMVQMRDADADDAVTNVTEALHTARASDDGGTVESRFRTSILVAYFGAGRVAEGLALLTEPGCPPWADGPVNLDNYYSRGFRALMISYMGQLDEANRDLAASIEMATQQNTPVSWFYGNVVEYCNLSGNTEQALSASRNAIARAQENQSAFFVANAQRAVATAACLAGNWQAAIDACESALPLTEKGAAGYQFRSATLAVYARGLLGAQRYDDALRICEQAISESQQRHARIAECQARLTMLSILRKMGKNSTAIIEQHLNAAATLIEHTGATMLRPFMLEERARLLWQTGQHEEGHKTLNQALQEFRDFGAQGHAERLQNKHPELAA